MTTAINSLCRVGQCQGADLHTSMLTGQRIPCKSLAGLSDPGLGTDIFASGCLVKSKHSRMKQQACKWKLHNKYTAIACLHPKEHSTQALSGPTVAKVKAGSNSLATDMPSAAFHDLLAKGHLLGFLVEWGGGLWERGPLYQVNKHSNQEKPPIHQAGQSKAGRTIDNRELCSVLSAVCRQEAILGHSLNFKVWLREVAHQPCLWREAALGLMGNLSTCPQWFSISEKLPWSPGIMTERSPFFILLLPPRRNVYVQFKIQRDPPWVSGVE